MCLGWNVAEGPIGDTIQGEGGQGSGCLCARLRWEDPNVPIDYTRVGA